MTMTEPVGAERAALSALRGIGPITHSFADLDAWRVFPLTDLEVRSAAGPGNIANFYGHASITDRAYPMYGGPDKGGWNETVDSGSFKRTLEQNPDTVFLLNHTGMTMARTKPGTLALAEDSIGLEVVKAELNRDVSAVNDMVLQLEAKNLDEMSFAFRVLDQVWYDADGEEVPWWDMSGVDRHIREVSIHQGDVSVVNYGANPFTDAGLRSLRSLALPDARAFAGALQEVRAGAVLSAATRSTLQTVLDAMSGAEDGLDEAQQTLSDLLSVPNPDDMPDMDGMMAAVQVEAQRRAFLLKHADF